MLTEKLRDEMKTAMRSGDKPRLGVVRLVLAAIKQREVDERIELNDDQVLVVLDKMVKQRRESLAQFQQAGRDDLASQEEYEIGVLQDFLPEALGEEEISAMISDAIEQTGAASIRDMGKVMGIIKPKMQGRADMSAVSAVIKQQLNS
ncbi:MAG: GatB/YqeY domain-containing protein [Candidatus Polarisedimenticolaceae bacterium]|nr:GatB/YqeY domain-containing protein [Candidatus Polarisedimenticolaceae bacterium]